LYKYLVCIDLGRSFVVLKVIRYSVSRWTHIIHENSSAWKWHQSSKSN